MVAQISFDPSNSSNINDATPQFRPGTVYEHPTTGAKYVYVQHHQGTATVASINGAPAYWRDLANAVVTMDKTDNEVGATVPHGCAGVYQGVVTHLRYTWLQKTGRRTNVRLLAGDSNGATGAKIFPPASDADADFRAEALTGISAAEIPAQEVGIQFGAGASNLATVLLMIK